MAAGVAPDPNLDADDAETRRAPPTMLTRDGRERLADAFAKRVSPHVSPREAPDLRERIFGIVPDDFAELNIRLANAAEFAHKN